MSDRELNLSVGTLPPIFNDWNEKCQGLEKKIERFRLIMERVPDAQLAEGITKEAEAEKAALRPEQQQR